jgi:hypothetical protein
MDWLKYVRTYRTKRMIAAKTPAEKRAAQAESTRYLPHFSPDPENPDVLISKCHDTVIRIRNTRQQLPFNLPEPKEDT